MDHNGKSRHSRWRLPRVLGAAALTAGLLAVALPAGIAQASAVSASPAATAAPVNILTFATTVKALGHNWTLEFNDGSNLPEVLLETVNGTSTELYQWQTSEAFLPTAAKELKVTSTGHATFATGTALSPVLSAAFTFTPLKATKDACLRGSWETYTGKISGALTLATGLRGVKFSLKFTGKTPGTLSVDKSCDSAPPVGSGKYSCPGGDWFVNSAKLADGAVAGEQLLGSKPTWQVALSQSGAKTASKWITRSISVSTTGPAPVISTAKKTISVSGPPSGAVTGAAIIPYSESFAGLPQLCTLNGKKYKETMTSYVAGGVKVIKPFQAHALLGGTVTMQPGSQALYNAVKLSAP